MIEVELPDGTIVEFPEGTSQDVMRQALMKLSAKSPRDAMRNRIAQAKAGTLELQPTSQTRAEAANVQAETKINDPGALVTALLSATQGATFNFGDEIAARAASIFPGGPSYEQGLATARKALSAGREARPGTALASELGGAMGSGLVTAAAIPARAAQMIVGPVGMRTVPAIGRGLLAGTGLGAAEGAVAGFGSGEGGAGERASSAASGAAMGGAFGGLLGAAMPLVARGAQNVVNRFRRSDVAKISQELGISKNAAKVIRMTFDQGGSLDDARAALARAGDEGMLADAGYAAQSLLDLSIQQGGDAARIGREAVDSRSAGISSRLGAALDETLGAPQGIESLRKSIREGTAAERGRLYDQAFAADIDWTSPAGEELRGLLSSMPEDVLRRAERTRQMAARPDDMAARYADEFAPQVTSQPGLLSSDPFGLDEVQAFNQALKEASSEKFMVRPLTDTIKRRGGIDPTSPIAEELRQRGITSKTTPGLFKRGGLKDLDNLDTSGLPDVLRSQLDDGGLYVNRQAFIDGLEAEMRGEAVRGTDEAMRLSQLEELQRLAPEMQARSAQAETAASALSPPELAINTVPARTVKDVDAIKRALDEIRYSPEEGLMGGVSEYAMEAGKRAREIRDRLSEISPTYRDALASAQQTIRMSGGQGAVKFGADMLKPNVTREAVASFLEDASQGEKAVAALGARQYVDDVLANATASISNPSVDIQEAMKGVRSLSSRATREKITGLVGSGPADKLFKRLDEAMAQLELRAATARGSATAARLSGKEAVEEITAPGVVGEFMKGEPVNMSKRLIQAVTGQTEEYTAAQRQKLYGEISKALTQKKGASARAALDYIDRAMKGQPLTQAQNEFVSQQIAGAMFAVGQPAARRATEGNQR